MSFLLSLPVLLLGGLEFPPILGVADELRGVEFLYSCFYLLHRSWVAYFIHQESGNVRFCSGQVPHKLQKTNRLRNPKRPLLIRPACRAPTLCGAGRVSLESLADLKNVGSTFVREVALNKLVDTVQRDKCTNRALCKLRPIGHKYLVSLFNNRPVASTKMPRCTWLKPNPRHNADADVDIVRRVWVELNEVLFADVCSA